jgi:hypothetical protein
VVAGSVLGALLHLNAQVAHARRLQATQRLLQDGLLVRTGRRSHLPTCRSLLGSWCEMRDEWMAAEAGPHGAGSRWARLRSGRGNARTLTEPTSCAGVLAQKCGLTTCKGS